MNRQLALLAPLFLLACEQKHLPPPERLSGRASAPPRASQIKVVSTRRIHLEKAMDRLTDGQRISTQEGLLFRLKLDDPTMFVSYTEVPPPSIVLDHGACESVLHSCGTADMMVLCPVPPKRAPLTLWWTENRVVLGSRETIEEARKAADSSPDEHLTIPSSALEVAPEPFGSVQSLKKKVSTAYDAELQAKKTSAE